MAANGPTDLQEKIAAARREADHLKEQIRARKERLADTSRKLAFRTTRSCSASLTDLHPYIGAHSPGIGFGD